jgi:hypothetical protein
MLTAVLPPRPSDEELAAEEARQAAELAQRRPTPTEGPGTELTAILASLGITAAVGCDCKEKAAQMNRWGVDGCRKHFWEIVGWLKDGQGRWGWTDYLRAAVLAVITGLAFQLDPTDPFPGILTEAIRRAEAKAAG